jgi:hypothetical protein
VIIEPLTQLKDWRHYLPTTRTRSRLNHRCHQGTLQLLLQEPYVRPRRLRCKIKTRWGPTPPTPRRVGDRVFVCPRGAVAANARLALHRVRPCRALDCTTRATRATRATRTHSNYCGRKLSCHHGVLGARPGRVGGAHPRHQHHAGDSTFVCSRGAVTSRVRLVGVPRQPCGRIFARHHGHLGQTDINALDRDGQTLRARPRDLCLRLGEYLCQARGTFASGGHQPQALPSGKPPPRG